MLRNGKVLLFLGLFALVVQEVAYSQKAKAKTAKSPMAAFFDDVYRAYQDMNGVLTFRTTVRRDHVQSLGYVDRLWGGVAPDPSVLSYPYHTMLTREPFVSFYGSFNFKPIRQVDVRLSYSHLPSTIHHIDSGFDPYSTQTVAAGTTINIAETLQVTLDFSLQDQYKFDSTSNFQGNIIDFYSLNGDQQTLTSTTYNRRIHSLTFDIRQLKNLFFEPRFRITWVNDQYSFFKSQDADVDYYIKSGNASEYTDGYNSEYQKHYLTLTTGFTLRPFNGFSMSGSYAMTPYGIIESTATVQTMQTHSWALSFNLTLNRNLQFVTSFTLYRSLLLQQSPYQSFFYDTTIEEQDMSAAGNNGTRNAQGTLLNTLYSQRQQDYESIYFQIQYR